MSDTDTIPSLAESYIQVLTDEHRHMSWLLSCLEAVSELMLTSGDVDIDRLDDIMQYVAHYPDLFHHPREEVLFRQLRRLNPRFADQINHATREHREMTQMSARIDAMVKAIEAGELIEKKQLVVRIREYVVMVRRHMAREEKELFEPALSNLSSETWQAILDEFSDSQSHVPATGEMQESYDRLYAEVASSDKP